MEESRLYHRLSKTSQSSSSPATHPDLTLFKIPDSEHRTLNQTKLKIRPLRLLVASLLLLAFLINLLITLHFSFEPIISIPLPFHPVSSPTPKTYFKISPHYAIHIVGERHSGTNWIEREMESCFGHAIPVTTVLFRFKHWWQSPSPFTNHSNQNNVIQKGEYGIVIALFRNPYDWVEAMRVEPHHAVDHWNLVPNLPLPWLDFVSKVWTMDRYKFKEWIFQDLKVLQFIHDHLYPSNRTENQADKDNLRFEKWLTTNLKGDPKIYQLLSNFSCYEEFYWFDIVPCSKKDRDETKMIVPFAEALYELRRDGSGRPYQNILELRREKLIHFYNEVSQFQSIQHFFAHRYEDLVVQGTQHLIEQVEKALPGVKARCQPSPPKKYLHKRLPVEMLNHLNSHLDWNAEGLVGYRQLSEADFKNEEEEYNEWKAQENIKAIAAAEIARKSLSMSSNNVKRDRSMYGIHIVGERHTGTSWVQKQLEQCFGDQVKIMPSLSRHKYWFQFDDPTKDYGMVVATFRNVYDWIQAMIEKPLHAPIHWDSQSNKPYPYQSFLIKEWGLDRELLNSLVKDDVALIKFYENANVFLGELGDRTLENEQCYDHFRFFDITPCSYEDRLRTASIVSLIGDANIDNGDSGAVYEMRRDHHKKRVEPYKNVLHFRRDKMINFASEIPKFLSVSHFTTVKFEDMVERGTAELIKEIEEKMGLQSNCTAQKLKKEMKVGESLKYRKLFVKMINDGTDWAAESFVGYTQMEEPIA